MRIPRLVVYAGLIVACGIGHFLLWKDKRAETSGTMEQKTIGGEKLA